VVHQLNVRVDDALFRDLRTAYAREIERRAALPRVPNLPWSAFVRDCLRAGIDAAAKQQPTTLEHVHGQKLHDATALRPPALTRAERRRWERERAKAR
jgi:hypothetical protein